uniref:Protein Smaug homolog 1 n=1 Tax=Cacopsylla melanoneura TaxID=428564 RepID=A0A8D8SKZ9_9HEMI
MHFQAQMSTLLHWLEQWNECSKTVAVVTLLTKLGPISAKFVAIALQQSLANLPQLELQEQEANNPDYFRTQQKLARVLKVFSSYSPILLYIQHSNMKRNKF